MGAAQIRYDVIAADGSVRKAEVIDMPHNALMHTFFLTENWVVFPVIPIDVDLGRAMKGGPMTAWVNDRPTRFAVMPRDGSARDVRWFDYEPRHMFHELNVWEQDGRIIADVAAANGTALFPDETGAKRTHGDTQQSLRRWTIDPRANGNGTWITEETLNDRDIQFPRPDDRFMTRASRHAFANINLNSRDGRAEGMDAVLRFDTVGGQEDVYDFGKGAACGELIFAPRMGAEGEGDGYVMTLVHRAGAATSELAIFAALDIGAGPIASVRIPFRVPSGFHCNFYAADSRLYREAFGEADA
jgi:carotenoid cleavage dioxygenase